MRDDPAFLAPILADPADDTARLVYADYMDETADARGAQADAYRARAELIRNQIEYAHTPVCRVCQGSGVFRGAHGVSCSLAGIDPANTDVATDKHVTYTCTECPSSRLLSRANWLLSTRYHESPDPSSKRIAGRNLWAPRELETFLGVSYTRGFVSGVDYWLTQFLKNPGRVAGCCPVEDIGFADVQPYRHFYAGAVRFAWVKDYPHREGFPIATAPPEYVLPEELFDEVVAVRDLESGGREDSARWLKWAAVNLSRKGAGLEPLKWSSETHYPMSTLRPAPTAQGSGSEYLRAELTTFFALRFRGATSPDLAKYKSSYAYYLRDALSEEVADPYQVSPVFDFDPET